MWAFRCVWHVTLIPLELYTFEISWGAEFFRTSLRGMLQYFTSDWRVRGKILSNRYQSHYHCVLAISYERLSKRTCAIPGRALREDVNGFRASSKRDKPNFRNPLSRVCQWFAVEFQDSRGFLICLMSFGNLTTVIIFPSIRHMYFDGIYIQSWQKEENKNGKRQN